MMSRVRTWHRVPGWGFVFGVQQRTKLIHFLDPLMKGCEGNVTYTVTQCSVCRVKS